MFEASLKKSRRRPRHCRRRAARTRHVAHVRRRPCPDDGLRSGLDADLSARHFPHALDARHRRVDRHGRAPALSPGSAKQEPRASDSKPARLLPRASNSPKPRSATPTASPPWACSAAYRARWQKVNQQALAWQVLCLRQARWHRGRFKNAAPADAIGDARHRCGPRDARRYLGRRHHRWNHHLRPRARPRRAGHHALALVVEGARGLSASWRRCWRPRRRRRGACNCRARADTSSIDSAARRSA